MQAIGGRAQENGGTFLAEGRTAAEHLGHRRKIGDAQEARRLIGIKQPMHAARTAEHAPHADHMARAQLPYIGHTVKDTLRRRADRTTLLGSREEPSDMCLGDRK